MERHLDSNEVDELVHYLQGTLMSFETAVKDVFGKEVELDSDTLGEVDQHIFNCDGCGWWYDLGEMSNEVEDDRVCDNCEGDYIE